MAAAGAGVVALFAASTISGTNDDAGCRGGFVVMWESHCVRMGTCRPLLYQCGKSRNLERQLGHSLFGMITIAAVADYSSSNACFRRDKRRV